MSAFAGTVKDLIHAAVHHRRHGRTVGPSRYNSTCLFSETDPIATLHPPRTGSYLYLQFRRSLYESRRGNLNCYLVWVQQECWYSPCIISMSDATVLRFRSSAVQPEWEREEIFLRNHMDLLTIELTCWSVSNELTGTVADESELCRSDPVN